MAGKPSRLVKRAAKLYGDDTRVGPATGEKRPELSELSEKLQEKGVPKKLADKVQKAIQDHPDSRAYREVGRAIHEVLEHKGAKKISEDSLVKISKEIVSETEKGASKEELRDLVREILASEKQKAEKLKRYQLKSRSKKARKKEEKPPLPQKKEGGMIQRKGKQKEKQQGKEKEWASIDMTKVNVTYPIYFKGGKIHVYANIRYDSETGGLLYRVIEPELTVKERGKLNKIENALVEELEVDFTSLKRKTAEKYLKEKIDDVIDYYNLKFSDRQYDLIKYYIVRDFIGLGKIEPLFQDPYIEDISCDGVGIPIYVYHRDPRFGSVKTNVKFLSESDLDSFVMKLAQRCGRSISVADPLLDGALPDGSRVQATYGRGISRKGSNFTIRKFTKDPMTFIDVLNYGTVSPDMLAYLWLAIEHGNSILIAGPTASGKTTLLNALSIFIRPELKVISIEDTPELRLPHENWISSVARTGFGPESEEGRKMGEITLFDLLKASLRQRPDNIIVGEVRGKEAYVLFQQMATGHPGLSTIHAESLEGVMNRLKTPPINLPPSLIQHLDMLIVLARQRIKGRYIRRVKNIVEITGYNVDDDRPLTEETYEWNVSDDTFNFEDESDIIKGAMDMTGSSRDEIRRELRKRVAVINWMQMKGIRDFKNVGRVIQEYYQNPDSLLKRIEGK